MIRWIAIFLLLLNFGFLAWNMLTPEQVQSPPSLETEPFYGTRLVLLSERPVSDLAAQNNKPAIAAAPESPAPPPAQASAETAKTVVPPAAPATSPAPVATDKSETKAETRKEVKTEPKPAVAAAPAVRPSPKACFAVGPFYLVSDVGRAAAMFEKGGVGAQQRASAERKQAGFWVYIPPRATLQEAREVLRALKDKDIYDALIIAEGEKQNSISVGVFHIEPQAAQRQDELKALGYKAVVEPLYRTQPQYWLDLELIEPREIPAPLWQKVSDEFSSITKTARKCD